MFTAGTEFEDSFLPFRVSELYFYTEVPGRYFQSRLQTQVTLSGLSMVFA